PAAPPLLWNWSASWPIRSLAAARLSPAAVLAGPTRKHPSYCRCAGDDLIAPFLLIARAAQDGEPCPADEALAHAYGTSSLGRVRRLIEHLEKTGLIVVRKDFAGRRSVGIPSSDSPPLRPPKPPRGPAPMIAAGSPTRKC